MIHAFFSPRVIGMVIFLFSLSSCYMKVYWLQDNRTRVPKDPIVYKNKIKFDKSLLSVIDTSVIYEEYSIEKNMLERDILDKTSQKYLVYKFYPNGCFNVFAFYKNNMPEVHELDPNYAGSRGIYYQENNQIQYEEFGAIDEFSHIGRIKGTFRVNGDTLYEKMNDRKGIDTQSYPEDIYIKRKLSAKYFVYKADW